MKWRRVLSVAPTLGSKQNLNLCQDRRWDQLFIQQKPFIHSKINHWVYSADIFKKLKLGGQNFPLCPYANYLASPR